MKLTQELIYEMIKNDNLRNFWLSLTNESKQMIVNEYNRNININKEFKNKVQCVKINNTLRLIIEKDSGLHFYNGNISTLVQSNMLKPQALISGKPSIRQGNIAPYCIHFVKVPFSFLLEDLKKIWEQMGEDYEAIPNANRFGYCCDKFLCMQAFMPNPYIHFMDSIPLIFVYKRKKFDIDIMNDNELNIHKEFNEYSYLVNRDDQGYSEFNRFVNITMAILGGINIRALDGIIISKDSFEHLEVKDFLTFDILVEYLTNSFPQLYISDECGNILYMPEKNKVILQKEIKNPFLNI